MSLSRTVAGFLIASLFSAAANGQERVVLQNGFSEPLYVWIWAKNESRPDQGRWLPKTYLPARGKKAVRLSGGSSHYLVGRDLGKNDDVLGWAKLKDVVARDPSAVYLIKGAYVTEQVPYEYKVTVMKREQRTRAVNVTEHVSEQLPDGTVVYRPVVKSVEQTYVVNVPVVETRQAARSVVKLDLTGRILSGGRERSIEEFLGEAE